MKKKTLHPQDKYIIKKCHRKSHVRISSHPLSRCLFKESALLVIEGMEWFERVNWQEAKNWNEKKHAPAKFLVTIDTSMNNGRWQMLSFIMPLSIMRPWECFPAFFTRESFAWRRGRCGCGRHTVCYWSTAWSDAQGAGMSTVEVVGGHHGGCPCIIEWWWIIELCLESGRRHLLWVCWISVGNLRRSRYKPRWLCGVVGKRHIFLRRRHGKAVSRILLGLWCIQSLGERRRLRHKALGGRVS